MLSGVKYEKSFEFISGPDLLFVIYPLGLSRLPSPAVWSFLFFLMVFTLGIDSQVIHRILMGGSKGGDKGSGPLWKI